VFVYGVEERDRDILRERVIYIFDRAMVETLYPVDREMAAIVFGLLALVGVATSVSSRGQSKKDYVYYDAIRSTIGFAPPRWLFGPVWTLLIALFSLSTIFYFIAPRTWHHGKEDYAAAALILVLVWLLTFALWTTLFFSARVTWLALLDAILLLGATIALLVVQWESGETRWWVTWLCHLPIIAWVAFAALLTAAVALNAAKINRKYANLSTVPQ
jgi:benzodiazapine receptor